MCVYGERKKLGFVWLRVTRNAAHTVMISDAKSTFLDLCIHSNFKCVLSCGHTLFRCLRPCADLTLHTIQSPVLLCLLFGLHFFFPVRENQNSPNQNLESKEVKRSGRLFLCIILFFFFLSRFWVYVYATVYLISNMNNWRELL